MKDAIPKTIYLKDYQRPDFTVETVHLTFELHDTETLVKSKLTIKRLSADKSAPLILNGEELNLVKVILNERELDSSDYQVSEEELQLAKVPDQFNLEIHNLINPVNNKALDGLYKSGNMFCTQNEPEGFRRITYYIDRPDVMATFTTKIIASKQHYPVLLSNGNLTGQGELAGAKHWVEWHDPFPKPCYLYALVAGDLGQIKDTFKTKSGRMIDLRIYCDKGNESKCYHAMESLKKCMRWDEERFNLEYDLDIFMIVAVDAFNMGAMENKGLNIFNSAYVLAKPQTATDYDYFHIEGVIGHEYFHNWTGNRITCRDWFQLTLKEGLTVYRDQEFSSDMNARGVTRAQNVQHLRAAQFAEDAGPTAHPIKPDSYIEINNFYTATIYEKGSEIIRMIHTLLGEAGFRKGMDKYFELYDGQAVTTEDFLHAFSLANNNFDFTQFKLWYSQSGTPKVKLHGEYNDEDKSYRLKVSQTCAPTPGQVTKKPFLIPLKLGLVGPEGKDFELHLQPGNVPQPQIKEGVLRLTQEQQTFVFSDIPKRPIISINRGFSAPIKMETDLTDEEYAYLMAHDQDQFNRFESSQVLGEKMLLNLVQKEQHKESLKLDRLFAKAFGKVLDDAAIKPAFKALMLQLPTEKSLHQALDVIDTEACFKVREFVQKSLAELYQDKLKHIYQSLNDGRAYQFSADDMGMRELKNTSLGLLMCLEEESIDELCYQQFKKANNMTDQLAAFTCLVNRDTPYRHKAIAEFYDQWRHETLVMQKWLMAQATSCLDDTYDRVQELLKSPIYDRNVPNLFRRLIGSFATNDLHFHHAGGQGYAFIANQVLEMDQINPQMASRLAGAFQYYKRLPTSKRQLIKVQLEHIKGKAGLSKNTYEIVKKILD